jgi:phage repressor protein C with HTH and peptisase S24 domain
VHLPSNSVLGAVGRGSVQSREIVDYLAFKADWMRRRIGIDPKSLMLIEAVSDSMAPTIEEGDLMLVDLREPRFRHDGVYVLRAGGALSIKRIQRRPDGKLIIRNDNAAYEPTVVAADNVNVVGHVIWIAGKL